MPEQVRCPECNAPLRVPDKLLGKNVKCPKCQTTFIAEMEEPTERQNVVREPSPARRARAMEETEEEDFLEEEEEEERPRRRRRRGRRRSAAAAEAVAGPAIALIVLGSIDIVLVILDMILSLAGVNFAAKGAGGPGPNLEFLTKPSAVIPGHVLGLCFATAILTGGLKMKQLQSYGVAMTASILALLPCGNCCCIGLPLGIWALVVLSKPEVKDAFR